MDEERQASYSRYINEPGIDARAIYEELRATLFLQEYDPTSWENMLRPLEKANLIIPFVDQTLVKNAKIDAKERGKDSITSLFQAIQMCLHPTLSKMLADNLNIDQDAMIIAATHIGVTEAAELYKISGPEEKQQLLFYAIYFAGAQAKVLGFKTSTSYLSTHIDDEANLRMGNITLLANISNEEDLRKAHTKALFEGHKVTPIRDLGEGKFFTID